MSDDDFRVLEDQINDVETTLRAEFEDRLRDLESEVDRLRDRISDVEGLVEDVDAGLDALERAVS